MNLTRFPNETQVKILSYLRSYDILNTQMASKQFSEEVLQRVSEDTLNI